MNIRTTQSRPIVFFGPVPPPLHGVSLSLQMCCEQARQKGVDIYFVATNLVRPLHSKSKGKWLEIGYMIILLWKAAGVLVFRRNASIYLACATKGPPVYRDVLLTLFMRPFAHRFTVHFHGTELADSTGFLRRLVTSAYARCWKIYGSKKLADDHRFLESPGHRTSIISNGVPDHQIASIDERFRKPLNNERALKILFLSNLLATKGLIEFIETLRQLKMDGVKFRANICGAWSERYSSNSLRDLLEQSGVIELVDFIGPVDQAQKRMILAESDILLFPSYRESFGNVVIEAMSAGVLVIANNTTAMSFILDDGRSGIILDPYTPRKATDIIKSLSTVDHQRLVASARSRYLSKFTLEKFSTDLIENLMVD